VVCVAFQALKGQRVNAESGESVVNKECQARMDGMGGLEIKENQVSKAKKENGVNREHRDRRESKAHKEFQVLKGHRERKVREESRENKEHPALKAFKARKAKWARKVEEGIRESRERRAIRVQREIAERKAIRARRAMLDWMDAMGL
jgi:hypothetical protein